MSLTQVRDNAGSAVGIIPVTLNNGALTATLGTQISFNVIGDVDYGFPMSGSESEDEFNEFLMRHGVTLRMPKVTKFVDQAGNELVGSTSGGGTGHSVIFTVGEQDYQFLVDMQGLIGDYFIAWFPLGETNADGFGWLLSRWDGDLRIKSSGNAINGVQLTAVGKVLELDSGVTAGDIITALATAVTNITEPLGNTLDPEAVITTTSGMLVAGDVANPGLLAGTLVFKKGA